MNHRIAASSDNLVDFCRKWKITELSLFGSVLREDFRPDSDIEVPVAFAPEARWSLLALARMQDELSGISRAQRGSWWTLRDCEIPSDAVRFSLPGRYFMLPEKRDAAYLWDTRATL